MGTQYTRAGPLLSENTETRVLTGTNQRSEMREMRNGHFVRKIGNLRREKGELD